mmetsp:Transcript_9388/g.36643  ORF Transcript_9388/g.36643 Transcript_9388/m.36643 type:complete len:84 (+) Transcript_9388:472-723(+)
MKDRAAPPTPWPNRRCRHGSLLPAESSSGPSHYWAAQCLLRGRRPATGMSRVFWRAAQAAGASREQDSFEEREDLFASVAWHV